MRRLVLAVALMTAATAGRAQPVPLGGGALVYQPGPAPFKAYVKELRTPDGVQVLLDSPPDHIHHHGLMLALGVDDTDFWGEAPPEKMGRQVPGHPPDGTETGLVDRLVWTAPGKVGLLEEVRRVSLRKGTAGAPSVVTWESILRPADGRESVRLWGRHYFGLGLRFVRDLDGTAEFICESGATNRIVRGDERLTPARWCAVRGTVAGKPVTVAMFDDPSNARHPTEWFTMAKPFAYLAATLGLEQSPMVLAAGRSLHLRWAVALWDGIVSEDTVNREFENWAGPAPAPARP